jgi:hypothetical protein
VFVPCLLRASLGDGQVPRLGHPLLDDYLDMDGEVASSAITRTPDG